MQADKAGDVQMSHAAVPKPTMVALEPLVVHTEWRCFITGPTHFYTHAHTRGGGGCGTRTNAGCTRAGAATWRQGESILEPGSRAGGTRARGLQETEKPLLQRMHVHENAKPLPGLRAAWALSLASLCCFEHSARSRSAALPSAPVRRRSQQRVRASHGLGGGHLPASRARIGAGR